MANFSDITGWQEELQAFRSTMAGQEFFKTSVRAHGKNYLVRKKQPPLPLSYIFELAELYLGHEMLNKDIEYWVAWGNAEAKNINLEFDDPEYFKSLREYYQRIRQFKDWYAMKKKCSYNDLALDIGSCIAARVVEGKFSTVRSNETVQWVRQGHNENIEIDI